VSDETEVASASAAGGSAAARPRAPLTSPSSSVAGALPGAPMEWDAVMKAAKDGTLDLDTEKDGAVALPPAPELAVALPPAPAVATVPQAAVAGVLPMGP